MPALPGFDAGWVCHSPAVYLSPSLSFPLGKLESLRLLGDDACKLPSLMPSA